jgi:putative ABC transport system permease protein
MIRNYLIIMLRSMRRKKFLTAINVFGLSVGITFALLIGMFVAKELEVNKTFKDSGRIFLIENVVNGQSTPLDFFTPPILSRTATEQYPTLFSDYFRFWERNITVSKGEKHFRIQCMMGDPSFLPMFGFTVLHGDGNAALRRRSSAVISKDVALKFFGRIDVVDESLTISTERNGLQEYRITAVIDEPEKKNTVTDLRYRSDGYECADLPPIGKRQRLLFRLATGYLERKHHCLCEADAIRGRR